MHPMVRRGAGGVGDWDRLGGRAMVGRVWAWAARPSARRARRDRAASRARSPEESDAARPGISRWVRDGRHDLDECDGSPRAAKRGPWSTVWPAATRPPGPRGSAMACSVRPWGDRSIQRTVAMGSDMRIPRVVARPASGRSFDQDGGILTSSARRASGADRLLVGLPDVGLTGAGAGAAVAQWAHQGLGWFRRRRRGGWPESTWNAASRAAGPSSERLVGQFWKILNHGGFPDSSPPGGGSGSGGAERVPASTGWATVAGGKRVPCPAERPGHRRSVPLVAATPEQPARPFPSHGRSSKGDRAGRRRCGLLNRLDVVRQTDSMLAGDQQRRGDEFRLYFRPARAASNNTGLSILGSVRDRSTWTCSPVSGSATGWPCASKPGTRASN